MSLSGSAFTWFTTLPANSIIFWADLEKQFHQFFYSGIEEMKLTDLTNLSKGMMNQSLPLFRGSEMLRTSALVWFYLISSLQRLYSKDSCHTSRKSMLPRSSTAS